MSVESVLHLTSALRRFNKLVPLANEDGMQDLFHRLVVDGFRFLEVERCVVPWFVDRELELAPLPVYIAFEVAIPESLVEELGKLH